jgi:formylglycine-generating enzyme required for sulfatase activity
MVMSKSPTSEFKSSVGGVMIRVPATMGSPESEDGHQVWEQQREVTFVNDFYLGKSPVTQDQYESVTGTNPTAMSRLGMHRLIRWTGIRRMNTVKSSPNSTAKPARAREMLKDLGEGDRSEHCSAFTVYHLCGEIEQAVDWLERAIHRRVSFAKNRPGVSAMCFTSTAIASCAWLTLTSRSAV